MSRLRTAAQIIGLTASLAAFCSAPAHGGVIIYTYDSTFDSPTGPFPVGSSDSFTLPQYDGPYPLQFVTLEVTGEAKGGSNIFDNESEVAGWAEVIIGASIDVTVNIPTAPVVNLVIPQTVEQGNITEDDPLEAGTPGTWLGHPMNADYAGTDSLGAFPIGVTDAKSVILGPGDDLTPYIGSGEIKWSFDSDLVADAQSNVPLGQSEEKPPELNFTARVVYQFITPEPGTVALLCMGLAPVLARRRRSRR